MRLKKISVFNPVSVFLCIFCFLIILYGTQKYGPGVTHDSVAYLYSASTLANGNGLQYFAYNSPFTQWPPLYSIILSISEFLGINTVTFSQYLNALIMALTLWVASRTVGSLSENRIMPALFILMGVVSYQLIRMSFYIWTEPMFLLFSAVSFHILIKTDFNSDSKTVKSVIIMGVFSALACLTRYVGVVLVAVICLYLLLSIRGIKKKISLVFLYGSVSVFPTIIYIIRNYMELGTLVGMKSPSGISFSTNLHMAVETVFGWFFSKIVQDLKPISKIEMLLVGLVFTAFLAAFFYKFKTGTHRPGLVVLPFYCVVYLLYMVVTASKVAFDPLNDRYMIPVIIPLLTFLVIILDGMLSKLLCVLKSKEKTFGKITLKLINIGLGAIASVFIIYFTVSNAANLRDLALKANTNGAGGFNSDYWRKHEFLSQTSLFEDSDMIYSNDPSAVYFLTGKQCHYTPKTSGLAVYGYDAFLSESNKYSKQSIIWFGKEESKTLYTPAMIAGDFNLIKLSESSLVSIYSMDKKN